MRARGILATLMEVWGLRKQRFEFMNESLDQKRDRRLVLPKPSPQPSTSSERASSDVCRTALCCLLPQHGVKTGFEKACDVTDPWKSPAE